MTELTARHLQIPAATAAWALARMAGLLEVLHIDREELESVAAFGLARGVRDWDPARSAQGELTYGSWLVRSARWEVLKFIKRAGAATRHPGGRIVKSLDWGGERGDEPDLQLGASVSGPDPGLAGVDADDLAAEVRRLLDCLDRRDRQCVESCVMRGRTYRDAAAAMGVSDTRVAQRVAKGKTRLRKMLEGKT